MSQSHPASKHRRRGFELLEGRCLLSISTADPQSLALAAPLNDGQAVFGSAAQREPVPDSVLQSSPATGSAERQVVKPLLHLPDPLVAPDTMGDFDVLIRVQATDAAGNPLSQINAGDEFYLRLYVQDTSSFGHGVFGAYLDIIYDSNLGTVTGPIEFAFPNGKHGTLSPGLIGEAGAFDDLLVDDRRVRLLFSVPMQAKSEGELTFAVLPPLQPGWDTLLYDLNTSVPLSRIHFQNSSLSVRSTSGDAKPGLPEYIEVDPNEPLRRVEKVPEQPAAAPPVAVGVGVGVSVEVEHNDEPEILHELTPDAVVIGHAPGVVAVDREHDSANEVIWIGNFTDAERSYAATDPADTRIQMPIYDPMGNQIAFKLAALNIVFDMPTWHMMESTVHVNDFEMRASYLSGQALQTVQIEPSDPFDALGIALAVSSPSSTSGQPDRRQLDGFHFAQGELSLGNLVLRQAGQVDHIAVRHDYSVDTLSRPIPKLSKKGTVTATEIEQDSGKVKLRRDVT